MPFPFGGREDRDAGLRFPLGPDGTILIPPDDPSVMTKLPEHLAQHGDFIDPATGPLEDPSRPTTDIFNDLVALMKDGLFSDKPHLLPQAMVLFCELVALRQGILPSDGQGEESTLSADELEPAALSLMTATNEHARVRAVIDVPSVQSLPALIGGLRQRKRGQRAAETGAKIFNRGIIALENRIDPIVRKCFTSLKAFEDIPEIWDMLEPVRELVSGAAERGQRTRDLKAQAKQEGYKEGFEAGVKAAEEKLKAAAATTPKP